MDLLERDVGRVMHVESWLPNCCELKARGGRFQHQGVRETQCHSTRKQREALKGMACFEFALHCEGFLVR